jgi:hypothetical protein
LRRPQGEARALGNEAFHHNRAQVVCSQIFGVDESPEQALEVILKFEEG